MRYGFINNFRQALAADLAAGATTMTLDGGGASIASPSTQHIYKLTIFDGDGNIEVINVTGVSGDTLTIVGEQEGTTRPAAGWPAGTAVEQRLTEEVVSGFQWYLSNDGIGTDSVSIQPSRNNSAEMASGYRSMAVGAFSQATDVFSVALGTASQALASDSLAVGAACYAYQPNAIAIGRGAEDDSEFGVCLGSYSQGYATSPYGIAIGAYANFDGDGSIALGHEAMTLADGQVAIGPKAYPRQIQSGMDLSAIPVMRLGIMSPQTYQHATAMRVTLPVLLRTSDIDMATTGDKDDIDLPASTALMVDRIESVVVSSAGSGSTPTISIGTTLGGSEILASHVMAGDTVLSREQLVSTPQADAVTALYFKVDTAAASAMTVRFIVHGYVMET